MRTCSIIEVINKYEYRNIAPYQKLQAGYNLNEQLQNISVQKKSENLHDFNEIQELIQACAKVLYWAVKLLHKFHFEIVL